VGFRIVLRPGAVADLKTIFLYVAEQAGLGTAVAYDQRLREACRRLGDFPGRGTPQEALRAGLRSVPFRRRATIYYVVDERTVHIVHILSAGRDPRREFWGD
jgi:toxin ParE1/3/4